MFNFRALRLSIGLVAFALCGCATTSPQPTHSSAPIDTQAHLDEINTIQQFNVNGKLGVIYNQKGMSGSIVWQHTINADAIDVLSPLGSKVASISKTPNHIQLTNDKNETIEADNAQALTLKTLGWELPLQGLTDWVLGRPSASKIDFQTWDTAGRLVNLQQDGWTIEYLEYTQHAQYSLPSKLKLSNARVRLKIVISLWQVNP
jgi:outer membrane lipoprotein LolB